MFKWLFGEPCKHDYRIIDTEKNYYYDSDCGIMRTNHKYILFCPKCNREKKVDQERYDREQEKLRLINTYRRNNR